MVVVAYCIDAMFTRHVAVHIGAAVNALVKVNVHPVGVPVPIVMVPPISVDCAEIAGPVPQADNTGCEGFL